MADLVFQSDLKIGIPYEAEEKATLKLNAQGDLEIIDGSDKLSAQLIRSLINDDSAIRNVLNSPVTRRTVTTLFNLILRTFRQNQIDAVARTDTSFSGYAIYRLESGTNSTYKKVSTDYVTYKYIDTNLTNGTTYRYAVAKAYNGIFESGFTERVSVTPYASASKQEVVIGTNIVAIAGDKQVTFYTIYGRKFMGSELLQDVLDIEVKQDTIDPRRYSINVVVKNLRGSQVPVSAIRHKASV